MRTFDYSYLEQMPIPADIVRYLTQIHEYRGKQDLYQRQQPEMLDALVQVAKIQSIGASNRIEGIRTSEKRLMELAQHSVVPRNRDEEEISGYRSVLETIHDSHDSIPLSANIILQLHRDLYRFSSSSSGGRFKNTDNIIEEIDESGQRFIRFKPLSAFETPAAMQALCQTFSDEIARNQMDRLVLILLFILDFLCIHPFNDGNGRMSRLLTLMLLYQADFNVGKYISIEQLIEKTKDNYYDSLQICSQNWLENQNEFWPFIRYMLGVVLAAYRELDQRLGIVQQTRMTKQERVRKIVEEQIGQFSKSDIMEKCPDIAKITIEKALAEMKSEGLIEPVGTGRGAKWRKR